jgi:hypothetical protein
MMALRRCAGSFSTIGIYDRRCVSAKELPV